MDENSFIIEKDGKEVSCDVCFAFICEENLKGYIAFTDHSKDETGKENLYIRSYDPEDEQQNLYEVSDEEYKLAIDTMNIIESKL